MTADDYRESVVNAPSERVVDQIPVRRSMRKFVGNPARRMREGALLLVVMACADSDATSPSRTGVRATSAHEISAGLTRTGRIAFVSTRAGNDNTEISR